RVLLVAVDDGIRKRLTKSQFNFEVASVHRSKPRNESHQLIYEWRDDVDVTRSVLRRPANGREGNDCDESEGTRVCVTSPASNWHSAFILSDMVASLSECALARVHAGSAPFAVH